MNDEATAVQGSRHGVPNIWIGEVIFFEKRTDPSTPILGYVDQKASELVPALAHSDRDTYAILLGRS